MSTINLRWPKPIWEEKKKKTNVIARNNNKKWSKKRLVPSLAATEEDGTAANLVRFIYPKSHAPSIERVASQKGRDGPPPIASGWSAQHHSSSPFHKRVEQVKFFPAKKINRMIEFFPPIHCLCAAWFNGLANSLLCDTRRKGCICKTRITHTPLSIATRLRAPPNETSIVFCACALDTVPAVVQPGRLVFLTRRGKKNCSSQTKRLNEIRVGSTEHDSILHQRAERGCVSPSAVRTGGNRLRQCIHTESDDCSC